jgi:hypothetical protein
MVLRRMIFLYRICEKFCCLKGITVQAGTLVPINAESLRNRLQKTTQNYHLCTVGAKPGKMTALKGDFFQVLEFKQKKFI